MAKIARSEALLQDINNWHMHLHDNLVQRTNFFTGLYSLVFALVLPQILKIQTLSASNQLAVLAIFITSIVSFIINIFVIMPRLKGHTLTNVFYYHDYLQNYTKEDYVKKIKESTRKDDLLIDFYVNEFYELSQNVLHPAFRKLHVSVIIFVTGVCLTLLFFLIGWL
ncbi:hypothetical protein JXA12_00650 [Candidatus Woesearchaeota archaeon]|nr:hypothetical protein [Candidatus Woesearchaeota archaeon]